MIGLMAALGLTVALFVSEVAFEDPKVKGTILMLYHCADSIFERF